MNLVDQPDRLLLVSHAAVIVQASFVLSGARCLRVSVSQGEGSQSAPRCRLVRSWTLGQQPGKQAVEPLQAEAGMGLYLLSVCWAWVYSCRGRGAPVPLKNCFLVCHSPRGLANGNPIG